MNAPVGMREDCRHFESRTYANGDTVRKCRLDLAPDAPWRCPDDCPAYEMRIGVGWTYGTLVSPPSPPEPPGLHDGSAAAVLDAAEDIVNFAALDLHAQDLGRGPQRRTWRRLWRRQKGSGRDAQ